VNRRVRLNLALVVAAAALGAGIWLAQKKIEKGPPLTPIASEALNRIRIAHPGAPVIELKKDASHWQLTAPVQAEADALEINALVDLAGKETHDPIAAPDLKQLGLDPPAYTITLNDTAIDFGGVEPIRYRRYVKVGASVALIEDPASAALDKDYNDLVAKELLPAGAVIEKVELPKLTLDKNAAGQWQLVPADSAAGADQMQRLADGWQHARAMWNEMATPADLKADRVKLTLKGGAVREFIVAATEPQLKLQRADLKVNYVLSKALEDELLKLPALAKPIEGKK
jgi:hypothetical protein